MVKFKEWYIERLRKKTVISELNGEKVYLSKGSMFSWLPWGIGKKMCEWGQIYPVVNEDTRKINWINYVFGGWRNMFKLFLALILIGFIFTQFKENYNLLGQAVECCNVCEGINLFP